MQHETEERDRYDSLYVLVSHFFGELIFRGVEAYPLCKLSTACVILGERQSCLQEFKQSVQLGRASRLKRRTQGNGRV